MALTLINFIIKPLIILTDLAEKMNNIDNKAPIN